MKPFSLEVSGAAKMKAVGRILAEEVLKIKPKKSLVFALSGELGSGKTTFVEGFAKGLGLKEKITSPTFALMKNYDLKTSHFNRLIHIDAYRLVESGEMLALGWQDLVRDPKNIIVVEWAKNIEKILPPARFDLKFDFISKNKRKINFNVNKN